MGRATTIKEYRERGVKLPFGAWLLDRWYTYVALLAVPLLIMGAIVYDGWQSFDAMAAPAEEDSEYQQLEPRDFLGQRFAEDFVEQHPEEVEDWEVGDSPEMPSPLFSNQECPDVGEAPETLLTTYSSSGEGISVTARIYGAGQARDYFDRAVSRLDDCDETEDTSLGETDTDPELALFTFNDTRAIFTIGDAIIEINSDHDDLSRSDVIDFYAEYAIESMQRDEWVCYDLTPSSNDSTRSFLYDFANYEGLFETELLTNETNIDNIPQPVLTRDGQSSAEDNIASIDNPDMSEPEAPLPDDFDEIPEEPENPHFPLDFDYSVEEFEEEAYYEIPDFTGPGCGWEWSAQISPIYDEEALDHNRDVTRVEVQNNVERQAEEYLNNGFYYNLRIMQEDVLLTRWNEHVSVVNSIHQDWQWLEDQRDELWPDWADYLQAHEEWSTFPERQQEAQDEYDSAWDDYEDALDRYDDDYARYEEDLEQCQDERDAVDEWDDTWGEMIQDDEAVPNGEDPYIEEWDEDEEEYVEVEVPEAPERPDDCLSLPTPPSEPSEPTRPAILDEERGSEPQPPEVPDGVTVPESWDDPAND